MNLPEIFGVDWIENLNESLTTRFDTTKWKIVDGVDTGIGQLGAETFKIRLQPQTYIFKDHTYNFVNVSFSKLQNGVETEELQLNSTNASLIIGAITNGIQDRTNIYDLDGIVFIAADNVQKRMRLYNAIARRKWAGLGTIIENVDIGGGRLLTALVSKELSPLIHDFTAHLAGLTK